MEGRDESHKRRCLQKPSARNDAVHADLPVERFRFHSGTDVFDRAGRYGSYLQSGHRTRSFAKRDEPVEGPDRSEEHTSELQSHLNLVCRLLLEKKNKTHSLTACLQPARQYNEASGGSVLLPR